MGFLVLRVGGRQAPFGRLLAEPVGVRVWDGGFWVPVPTGGKARAPCVPPSPGLCPLALGGHKFFSGLDEVELWFPGGPVVSAASQRPPDLPPSLLWVWGLSACCV